MADKMNLNFKKFPRATSVQWPERSEITDYDTGYIDVSQLFSYMRKLDLNSFENLLNKDVSLVNSNLEDHTLLQYACEYGLYDFVDLLVRYGADVNSVCERNKKTGLMLACEKGYYRIVELLVDIKFISFAPIDGETILHTLVQKCRLENLSITDAANKRRDYFKCLEMVLVKSPLGQLKVNQQDLDGCTALHYVAKTDNQNCIFALLNSGACIGTKNNLGKPAVAYISPAILKAFLDQCICTNGRLPLQDNYEVIFDYNFLTPPKHRKTNRDVIVDVKSDECSMRPISETESLVYICKSRELQPLLKHPVLTSFIRLKWHSVRWLFCYNLVFYASFSFLLTIYILGFYNVDCERFELNQLNNTDCCNNYNQPWKEDYEAYFYEDCCQCFLLQSLQLTESVLWFTLVSLLVLLVLRQIFQLVLYQVQHIRSENTWIEILLIIVTSLILLSYPTDPTDPSLNPAGKLIDFSSQTRNTISAVGVLLSWGELWILIERHPWVCTKIGILKTMTRNFFELLAWCSVLIFAVALSFYTISKTIVLVAFYESWLLVFNNFLIKVMGVYSFKRTDLFTLPDIRYLLYLLQMFLVTTILLNLLYGMAICDAESVRKEAELVGLVSRVKLISYIETVLQGKFVKYCFPETILSYYTTLFPDTIPRIRILPNQENKVIFAQDGPGCFANRRNFMMEESVVKAATKVLGKQVETISKTEEILIDSKKMLDEYGQRFQQVEKLVNQRRNSAKRWKNRQNRVLRRQASKF